MTNVWDLLTTTEVLTQFLSTRDIGILACLTTHHSPALHQIHKVRLSGSKVRACAIIGFLRGLCRGRYPKLESLYLTAPSITLLDRLLITTEFCLYKSGSLLLDSLDLCQRLRVLTIADIDLSSWPGSFFASLPPKLEYLYLCNTNLENTDFVVSRHLRHLTFCCIDSTKDLTRRTNTTN